VIDPSKLIKGLNKKPRNTIANKLTEKEKEKEKEREKMFDEFVKEPCKILRGHKKAIKEIAYSERHKILVSCGFDFEILVWNPYYEESIIKLDGHESPLVGVNCPPNLNSFVTCDTKGMVKVWNINSYSCT
jgi:WD40 repeat protein